MPRSSLKGHPAPLPFPHPARELLHMNDLEYITPPAAAGGCSACTSAGALPASACRAPPGGHATARTARARYVLPTRPYGMIEN